MKEASRREEEAARQPPSSGLSHQPDWLLIRLNKKENTKKKPRKIKLPTSDDELPALLRKIKSPSSPDDSRSTRTKPSFVSQEKKRRKEEERRKLEEKKKAAAKAELERIRREKAELAKLKEREAATFSKPADSTFNRTYDITPARHELPPQPLQDEDNYGEISFVEFFFLQYPVFIFCTVFSVL